jgi:hypothetical protein
MRKDRIRVLRVISRIFSVILSLCVFIPIAFAFTTFLNTRNTYRDVVSNGVVVNRNPWAKNSKVWPSLMYFIIAVVSLALNLIILVAYWMSVKAANKAAMISLAFDWIVIGANFGVWVSAVVVYRNEKDKNGVHNDLWGWSCSDAAAEIQKPFDGVLDFGRLCTVQVNILPLLGSNRVDFFASLHHGILVCCMLPISFSPRSSSSLPLCGTGRRNRCGGP